jgi:hypothetical protein
MRIVWIILIILGCLGVGVSPLIGSDVIMLQCKQLEGELRGADCEISISGPFFSSQSVNPGDSLYFYKETITKNIPTPLVRGGFKHKMVNQEFYSFVGRTGEKTFELKHTYYLTGMAKPIIEEKNPYYFDASMPLELKIMGTQSNCDPKEMRIQVKLIDLKGSKLECQVVLPGCLKDR